MNIYFKDWLITPTSELLARQYDNLSRSLVVTGDLPEGWNWKMKVECAGNYDSIPLTPIEGGVGAVLTEDQLAFGGYQYDMQLMGTNGDVRKHTNVIQVYIPSSLSGGGNWPAIPSEFTAFEARMRDITAHPPIPGDNGYWQLWNPDTEEYADSQFPLPEGTGGGSGGTPGADGGYYTPSVTQPDVNTMQVSYTPSKTGMPAVQAVDVTLPAGPQGEPGSKGDSGPQGPAGATPNIQIGTVETLPAGSPATASMAGTPENPLLNLGIPKGADGSTPQKGVDYWTAKDQQSVVADVLAALPTWEGGSY